MNLSDKSTIRLTNRWDNFPLWSPKGDRIAFVRRLGRRQEAIAAKTALSLPSGPMVALHILGAP